MSIEKIGQQAIKNYGAQKELGVTNVTNQGQAGQAPEAPAKPKRDEVTISDAAQQLRRAETAVKESPEVREDKVAALRKQIQEGTYNVPAEVLLDKILGGSRNG